MKESKYVEIINLVDNYKTKYPQGFIESKIEDIVAKYPEINKEKFDGALIGITCMKSPDNELIIYHCDIKLALICSIENRNPTVFEMD